MKRHITSLALALGVVCLLHSSAFASGMKFRPAAGGSGTPGGSNTEVQYNDSGSFGGDSGLVYNETTNNLSIAGDLTVSGDNITATTNTDRFVFMANGSTYAPEAINLGTDTVGNYANGDAEAGAALAGDSATSFFSTGTLEAAIGGTGNASYTKGDLLAASAATTLTKLGVGSDGQFLSADSSTTTGLRWASRTSYDLGTVVTMTDGATITPNLDLGKVFKVTLGGNRTLGTPINGTNGRSYIFIISQDATGSRTLGYSPYYRFGTDVASPTLSTTAGRQDYLGMVFQARGNRTSMDVVAVSKGYADP